jgi:hypothetical protein
LMVRALRIAMARHDLCLRTTHAFSCDSDPNVQRWLKDVLEVDPVIADASELPYKYAINTNNDKRVEIRKSHVGVAGPPCVDVSSKNGRASLKENANCVADGTMSTGSVIASILRLFEKSSSLTAYFLENVG